MADMQDMFQYLRKVAPCDLSLLKVPNLLIKKRLTNH